jgi:5,10-methylenetetrahydrofolate reductase
MQRVRDLGLHEKCFILVGVGPLASAKAARFIRANVPGVYIPDHVIARIEGAQNQKAEGKRICVEIIQQVREIAGVSGIHLMAYKQEESISEIVHESGVLAGRVPWRRDLVQMTQAVETQGAA